MALINVLSNTWIIAASAAARELLFCWIFIQKQPDYKRPDKESTLNRSTTPTFHLGRIKLGYTVNVLRRTTQSSGFMNLQTEFTFNIRNETGTLSELLDFFCLLMHERSRHSKRKEVAGNDAHQTAVCAHTHLNVPQSAR